MLLFYFYTYRQISPLMVKYGYIYSKERKSVMKTEHIIPVVVAVIGLIGTISAAIIGAVWGRNNVNIIVQQDGKEITLDNNGVKVMASENEDLKIKITDYEAQIENLKDEKESLEKNNTELKSELNAAKGTLDEVPIVEFKNYGLSIEGEEKTINKDRSFASINGRRYFSQDFVDNLLPDNKSAIEKDDMIYVGRIIKEKANLLDMQIIDQTNDVVIETNIKDTYGNIHNKALVLRYIDKSATFNSNRNYSNLKFKMGVVDKEKGGGIIQIESEQGIIFTSDKITSTTEPTEFDIPINQASRITIKVLGDDNRQFIMFTDAVLYNVE